MSTFEADSEAFTPTFCEHPVRGQTYTIVDEWCDGFLQGVRLAQGAWQPLLDSRPNMLKPFELFATPEGWAELDAADLPASRFVFKPLALSALVMSLSSITILVLIAVINLMCTNPRYYAHSTSVTRS